MDNKYAQTMAHFFKSVDKETEAAPSKLALALADYFREGEYMGSHIGLKVPSDNVYNVSIVSRQTPLSFITRKFPLVADTTIISHYGGLPTRFYAGSSWFEGAAGAFTGEWYLRCSSLTELGTWLKQCKPLLLQGDIFYLPDILVKGTFDDWTGMHVEMETDLSTPKICDIIIENKKLVDVLTRNVVQSQLIRPVVSVNLPYIESVDLETFAKITADERRPIERFRDFLRMELLELKQNEKSEFYESDLLKIGIKIRDGVRNLDADFTTLKRNRAFQVTGAVIAASTAVLVAVNSAAFSLLPELLGTSGGLLALFHILEKYISEKKLVQESPYYYIWLLSKAARKR